MWKRDQSVAPPEVQRNRAADRPPDVPSPDRSRPKETLMMNLGDSVFIKGELSGSEDLTLCGQMEGSVRLPDHTLTIGPNAKIDAEITAKSVVVTLPPVSPNSCRETPCLQAALIDWG